MNNPGETLRKLHNESGISQAQVCSELKMDTGNYSRLIRADDMMCSTFLNVVGALGYKVEVKKK